MEVQSQKEDQGNRIQEHKEAHKLEIEQHLEAVQVREAEERCTTCEQAECMAAVKEWLDAGKSPTEIQILVQTIFGS